MLLGKLSFFAHVISPKGSTDQQKQLQKNAFMSKQVSKLKSSSILQEMKISPKAIYPFLHESLQLLLAYQL